MSYYELKEATSTFELALWKSKLDQADATNTTNRAAYRIDVPGPVKDTMLQYLDYMSQDIISPAAPLAFLFDPYR